LGDQEQGQYASVLLCKVPRTVNFKSCSKIHAGNVYSFLSRFGWGGLGERGNFTIVVNLSCCHYFFLSQQNAKLIATVH
jgi:hypothetical protein